MIEYVSYLQHVEFLQLIEGLISSLCLPLCSVCLSFKQTNALSRSVDVLFVQESGGVRVEAVLLGQEVSDDAGHALQPSQPHAD